MRQYENTYLRHELSTGSTGRNELIFHIRADGHCPELPMTLRYSHGEGTPLGTDHKEGGVLDVTTGNDRAVLAENRRADLKLGVWAIGILHHRPGGTDQLLNLLFG